jgi:hypothetical protein
LVTGGNQSKNIVPSKNDTRVAVHHFFNGGRIASGSHKAALFVIKKVTFYGYLFYKPFDRICQYDILWKSEEKFLLKKTQIDTNYVNDTQQITVTVFDNIRDAIAAIILQLRNLEIESRVYKKLKPMDSLDEVYEPLLALLQQAISAKIKSFAFFGHLCKFRPQTSAKNFLQSMGYFMLTTRPPHLYVLDDFVKNELKRTVHH